MSLRELRFRIALPAANIILGVLLFHLGDLQVRNTAILHGGFEEPPSDALATAKYVHYALNAPAWALLGDTREWVWSPSTYWRGRDLAYFVCVLLLWTLIGTILDQQLGVKHQDKMRRRWRGERPIGWAVSLYGLFVCYRVLPKWNLESLAGYLSTIKDYVVAVLKGGYGWWFVVAGFAWGVVLITLGLYLACRPEKQAA